MAIHVALLHRTTYRYDRPVSHLPHVIRLRPAPHCRTRVLSYSLRIHGGEHFINWQQDPFSNWNARVVFPKPMRSLEVEVDLVAEMSVYNPFDFFLEDEAATVPFEYDATLARDLAPFFVTGGDDIRVESYVAPWSKRLAELAALKTGAEGEAVPTGSMGTLDFLVELNQALMRDIRYVIRLEPGVQPPGETLEKASGSCRDSAWLMCEVLRRLGFAARFVSGYLIQLKPDVKSIEGPSGAEADFTDLHAWCEVYLPGAGWIGFDPTSGLLAGEGHLPLSCTPEPTSAAPVSGAVESCESEMVHEMEVHRVFESPRVTRPYSEAQWERIDALARKVDAVLMDGDVRLTMGAEPTFVSMANPDGLEWNFTALSAEKRRVGGELVRRLRERFARGALLHYGQGKWYPGESLPRWSLNAFWRVDGVAVWEDDRWIADEGRDYGYGAFEAGAFAERLATELGVNVRHVSPAYEDAYYYLWRERRLPVNVCPEDSRLENAEERERLRRVFGVGLGATVGYVLPLRHDGIGWESGPWFFRDEDVIRLLPGDSPMGLRLPLDGLPWAARGDRHLMVASDPSGVFGDLPARLAVSSSKSRVARPAFEADRQEKGAEVLMGRSVPGVVRTALCVEPREGRLHVFLPPLFSAEAYLDLVQAVEATAAALNMPVIVEGEPPPRDARLSKLSVTPDPGVLEVNLHPSASWDELVERFEGLYEDARQCGLGAEKFLLDGRHVGTGGGNHIILGGARPIDSPLLRRPDLLRSMVTYWQNHPSLSWIFSGMFIGPTSQAPRVDEARMDVLHELEIAFAQLPEGGVDVPSWLVDRLFRNLLIDSTGNTHRAEFCIDKLYAPESSTGRLGLLELRAFEMAPHPRMNLVQQLLLRGLVAMFWERPYVNRLVRWGSDLHDRWMLPHFCETDFRDVLEDLRRVGFGFEGEWFEPHFEHRFPRIGSFTQRDVHVELRMALEPWHVLGEEPAAGGTVRSVDSSLERLQVKVRGMVGDRFRLLCNGRHVPLHGTGTNAEAVAGVRYRAWQPPSCLHPTIPPHAPLVFDLWDSWNHRSLGGCTYHVAHSGGRNYETRPLNAYEAESRRLARFSVHGHTPSFVMPPEERVQGDFPFTLDLRVPALWSTAAKSR
jgi:uncharacterized protein (DUF2126 family)/transglutaminase-like putative cysteine protease